MTQEGEVPGGEGGHGESGSMPYRPPPPPLRPDEQFKHQEAEAARQQPPDRPGEPPRDAAREGEKPREQEAAIESPPQIQPPPSFPPTTIEPITLAVTGKTWVLKVVVLVAALGILAAVLVPLFLASRTTNQVDKAIEDIRNMTVPIPKITVPAISAPTISVPLDTTGITDSEETISEAELGLPIYPGAEIMEDSILKVVTQHPGGEVMVFEAEFISNDPVATIVAWYKERLQGQPGFQEGMTITTPGDEQRSFNVRSGDVLRSVDITQDKLDYPGKALIDLTFNSRPQ